MQPLFQLDDVSLSFPLKAGPRAVLRDIALVVQEREILTIVGASGTGKTSLLRILAGLTRQSSGQVLFRGHGMSGPEAGVATIFQDYTNALLQWRTVARNVALGVEKAPRAEVADRVATALRLVKLQDYANDYPWQLSGGMQQRVQIARALAVAPSVLLMDEPFAALDAMTKASLQDELLRVRDETGASIVFITHDIEESVYLGDRVIVLEGTPGRIAHSFATELPFPRDQVVTRELRAFLRLRHAVHDAIGRHV